MNIPCILCSNSFLTGWEPWWFLHNGRRPRSHSGSKRLLHHVWLSTGRLQVSASKNEEKDLKYKNYVTEHHNNLLRSYIFSLWVDGIMKGAHWTYKLDVRENSCSALSEIVSQYFFCHVYKYPTVSCRSRFSSRFTLRRWVLFARVFRTLKTLEG